jgi:hypothetical protein
MHASQPKLQGVSKLIAVSLCLLLVVGANEALGNTKTAKGALKSLVKQTRKLPPSAASRAQRNRLLRIATHARRAVKKKPCTSVKDLDRYRNALAKVKVRGHGRSAERLAALGPASLEASRVLLASPRTRKCGGGVEASGVDSAQVDIVRSDSDGMDLHITLPDLNFVPETGGGQTFTKLTLPDTDSPAAPGQPAIPVESSTFAIPDGASLSVSGGAAESYKLDGVNVYPAQPDVVDDGAPPDFLAPPYADLPFTIDRDAYNQPGLVPAAPASGDVLGNARDVTVGGLQVPAAQYNPVSDSLTVFKSINVKVAFLGGTHTFSPELSSPWETFSQSLVSVLLNRDLLLFGRSRYPPRRCGEEMLVITNPATLAAANQFATARSAAGIRTVVLQTGTDPGQIGTTPEEIQTVIRNHLTRFLCVHPSYVTIMGDDDLVPTFPGINGIPSDLQYSMRDDTDELPDVAVGRILGNDQAAVGGAVTKIVNYENSPPTSSSFLDHAVVAAQFQDDDNDGTENRTFIQFAETVRNGLVNRGVTVDRVYGESPGDNPQKFNDGTDLPAELKKPTFTWTGTAADVIADWNAGPFMVVHRDHGYSDGWGIPGVSTTDVDGLTNGANLPVLLSINCSSGAFDYDETSFASEALVNPAGGAVGVFGDTRDSPTWHNSQLALGFVDALLPSVLPSEGPATKQRMGAALINGKVRLAGLSSPATDGNTRNELYLWHYFGDPSMQMWGGGVDPLVLETSQIKAVYLSRAQFPDPPPGDPPPYGVNVQFPSQFAGQPFSLLFNGQVIGKALAGDGVVNIPADIGGENPKPGDLEVAFEADGAAPIKVPVSDVPKQTTTLTQVCPSDQPFQDEMTITGTLSPAQAGATVSVRYTRPDQATFTDTVTTDANGGWSDTIVPGDFSQRNTGDWTIQASYAGDSTHAASTAAACTVNVFDNS